MYSYISTIFWAFTTCTEFQYMYIHSITNSVNFKFETNLNICSDSLIPRTRKFLGSNFKHYDKAPS